MKRFFFFEMEQKKTLSGFFISISATVEMTERFNAKSKKKDSKSDGIRLIDIKEFFFIIFSLKKCTNYSIRHINACNGWI